MTLASRTVTTSIPRLPATRIPLIPLHLRPTLLYSHLPKTPIRTHRTTKMTPPKIPSSSISILRTLDDLHHWRQPHATNQRLVALVPTMGALHAGHLSLIRAAAAANHEVIVSIYLNPAQFGLSEDLDSYPQTWPADTAALAALDRELADDGSNLGRISAVFAPDTSTMYPSGPPGQEVSSAGSFVTITPVGGLLEGASRPTFFRGVATICMKLFSAVQPNRVYFGQKDVQQTVVIKTLVRDFLLPIQVNVVPTQREPDGLALSSRNVYLGDRRRAQATVLYRALQAAEKEIEEGISAGRTVTREAVLKAANGVIEEKLAEQRALPAKERVLFEVDYLSVADPKTLKEVDVVDMETGVILSTAIRFPPVEEPPEGENVGHMGGPAVRLIDNIIVTPRK